MSTTSASGSLSADQAQELAGGRGRRHLEPLLAQAAR